MKSNLINVLLIDSDKSAGEYIKETTRDYSRRYEEHLDLKIVHNLTEARSVMESFDFHMIVADYWLPDGKGLDLLSLNREQPSYPIILLVDNYDNDLITSAIESGIVSCLIKSKATFLDLPEIISNSLTKWNLNRPMENIIESSFNNSLNGFPGKKESETDSPAQNVQNLQAIGAMTSSIAHDLNNFLTPIMSYTTLALNNGKIDNKTKSCLHQVLKAATRAKELNAQVVNYSKRPANNFVPIQISTIIDESISFLKPNLPSTIKLCLDMDAEDELILADSCQILQLIMNLGINAGHAIGENNGIIEVNLNKVTLPNKTLLNDFQGVEYIHIGFSDNGCGISHNEKEKIFESYYTTKEEGEGSGLGLYIVKKIVNNHKGKITVESKVGKGTTFHIYFPITDKIIEKRADIEVVSSQTGVVEDKGVLFVNNDDNITSIGKSTLEQLGYKVTVCKDCEKAMVLFKEMHEDFDIVIINNMVLRVSNANFAKEVVDIKPSVQLVRMGGSRRNDENAVYDEPIIDPPNAQPLNPFNIEKSFRLALRQNLISPDLLRSY